MWSRPRVALHRGLTWLSDRGLFRHRLEHHLVICGLPRSGSTLLQAWLEQAIPDCVGFARERAAAMVVRKDWPGAARRILTKRPDDVLYLEAIREAYQERPAKVSFILTTRDPRAVLVSKHGTDGEYYVDLDRWQRNSEAIERHRSDPDVLVLDYADLVQQPETVTAHVDAFLGIRLTRGLSEAHRAVPAHFEAAALNGVRPIETSRLRSWEQPEHRDRLLQILTPAVCAHVERYYR